MADGQREIDVEIFQGEHSLVRDNVALGRYVLRGIPSAPAGRQAIDVRFTYDLNGILEVEMQIRGMERVEHVVIEQRAGKLSKDEIARARKEMERLKFHPREALPNRTALARADALFVELTGPMRDELGYAIATFRSALEGQSPAIIVDVREQLNGLVAALSKR